jgi:inorganic triphosphatase YgiF
MSQSYVERELKFDVDPTLVFPAWELALPKGRLERSSERLRSDYYDTPDQVLLRAEMTLRRRTRTTDTGGQLKAPHAPFRQEIRVEVGSEAVPAN